MLLVTGGEGLIGSALIERLSDHGISARSFDVKSGSDVRDTAALASAMEGVTGIVALAAVSRVVWAQRDPELTEAVNVAALDRLLALATASPQRPWVVFASSREVYGEPQGLPVNEAAPRAPLNVYARSKVAGELAMEWAASAGLVANIARFSNVYGSVADHADRVVPAFARAAASGATAYLEGPENTFDFTHVDDVADGLLRLVMATASGRQLPPIHFVSGRGTTLRELADLAEANSTGMRCEVRPSRNYDVSRFIGDPARAMDLLGWQATTPLEQGFAALVEAFRKDAIEAACGLVEA